MSRFWSTLLRVLCTRNTIPVRASEPLPVLLSEPELDRLVLSAAAELLERQQELLPVVTEALGMDPYDYWIIQQCHPSAPRCEPRQQSGTTANAEWEWYFHGLECDIKNLRDGRFVRLDFGPRRNRSTFTSWGVMQFVMTSKPPWHLYESLRAFLAEKPPPYDEYSGTDIPVRAALDRLQQQGLVDWADRELHQISEANRVYDEAGNCVIRLPEELKPDCGCDVFTCTRLIVTSEGIALATESRRWHA